MRRFGILTGLTLALAIALPVAASGNPGTVSVTRTWHDAPEVQTGINPCTGHLVTAYLTSNGVEHLTFFENGDEYWYTLTDTATFTATDGDIEITGHSTFWIGGNWNERNQNQTVTFEIQARGSDGSHISLSEVAHIALNALGEVTVSFDMTRATCR
jgi:hypothetical protein